MFEPLFSWSMKWVAASILYSSARRHARALFYIFSAAHRRFNEVPAYENEFGKVERCPYSIAAPMARIALFHILRSLGLKPGDKVLLSPVTIPEMISIIQALRLVPVFVDFAEGSLFIDAVDLENKAVGAKALLLTFIAGQMGDLGAIAALCKKQAIALIQDCTQASQCSYRDQPLASWGDYTFFSTCEFKFIHTYRGAVICLNAKERYEELKKDMAQTAAPQKMGYLLKKWFLDMTISVVLNPFLFSRLFHLFARYIFTQDPLSHLKAENAKTSRYQSLPNDIERMRQGVPAYMFFRPSNFEARLGVRALRALPERVEAHRAIAKRYISAWDRFGVLPKISSEGKSSFLRFPLILKNEDQASRMVAALWCSGIIAERTGLSLLSRDALNAQSVIGRTVFIPCHARLADSDVQKISEKVAEVLAVQ